MDVGTCCHNGWASWAIHNIVHPTIFPELGHLQYYFSIAYCSLGTYHVTDSIFGISQIFWFVWYITCPSLSKMNCAIPHHISGYGNVYNASTLWTKQGTALKLVVPGSSDTWVAPTCVWLRNIPIWPMHHKHILYQLNQGKNIISRRMMTGTGSGQVQGQAHRSWSALWLTRTSLSRQNTFSSTTPFLCFLNSWKYSYTI